MTHHSLHIEFGCKLTKIDVVCEDAPDLRAIVLVLNKVKVMVEESN
jgi:hypothetical protein